MRKLVQTVEVDGEGLEALLGEHVMVWCANYIYSGTLAGVNERDILLEGAHVVYQTGPLTDSGYEDAQPLPGDGWYVRIDFIESYGMAK